MQENLGGGNEEREMEISTEDTIMCDNIKNRVAERAQERRREREMEVPTEDTIMCDNIKNRVAERAQERRREREMEVSNEDATSNNSNGEVEETIKNNVAERARERQKARQQGGPAQVLSIESRADRSKVEKIVNILDANGVNEMRMGVQML